MVAQVKSWGNSQGIRLSKELLESAGIRLNDVLNIEVRNNEIILVFMPGAPALLSVVPCLPAQTIMIAISHVGLSLIHI